MKKRDPYAVLDVPRDADPATIKKAFRKKAKDLHPDKNKDDPTAADRFKEVNEAYDILKDDEKKAAYDQFGHEGLSASRGPRNPNTNYNGFRNFNQGFHNFNQGPVTPHPLEERVPVDYKTMVLGGKVNVRLNVPVQTGGGSVFMFTQEQHVIQVDIPKDCLAGAKIVVPESDHNIKSATTITLHVFPARPSNSDNYQINGPDIIVPTDIDIFSAMFGEEVRIDLPYGKSLLVNIPEGTNTGQRIRLANQGVKTIHGDRGDLYLIAVLKLPELTDEEKSKIADVLRAPEA